MSINKKILFFGLLSSFFFSFTFILNRSMSLSGDSFLWSSSLRYIFSFPFLFLYVLYSKRLKTIHKEIFSKLRGYTIWSFVGFVMFYIPLTFASNYGTSWLVAASWQFSIVAGILITPLFNQKLPKERLYVALLILVGVALLQVKNFSSLKINDAILTLIPVIIASFSYILGNRKIMSISSPNINTFERIYIMTVCTLPFWLVISFISIFFINSLPSHNQILQSFMVCIFSALIATILFFYATDLGKSDPKLLALAESTIAGEVIFTVIGGYILLHDPLPDIYGIIGLTIIVIGILINSKIQIK